MSKAKRAKLTLQTCPICQLPEDILVHVFSFLDLASLLKCSRTCRLWQRLSDDSSLWRSIRLAERRLTVQSLWKVVRRRFNRYLTSLSLRGFYGDSPPLGKRRKCLLSVALVDEIKSRCRGLKRLVLKNCDLRNVSFRHFPTDSLEFLTLENCVLMSSAWAGQSFPKLASLNLSRSSIIDLSHVEQISSFPNLIHVDFGHCFRLKDKAVTVLSENASNLQSLSLSGCSQVTDEGVHKIARNLKHLKRLNLRDVSRLTDAGVSVIANTLANRLEELDVSQCLEVTDQGMEEIGQKMQRLRYLNVALCQKTTNECIDALRLLLPNCSVVTELAS